MALVGGLIVVMHGEFTFIFYGELSFLLPVHHRSGVSHSAFRRGVDRLVADLLLVPYDSTPERG